MYGGILTGSMIREEMQRGIIKCDHFNESQLNPNSYNLTIGNTYNMITDGLYTKYNPIDLKQRVSYVNGLTIPTEGLILYPGNLYLIPTFESIGSDEYVIIITGRSSLGRVGVEVHREAGFGDIGFYGKWTLQINVMFPTVIYPNMAIAQAYFMTPYGDTDIKYHGKYQNATDAIGSMIYKDFEN